MSSGAKQIGGAIVGGAIGFIAGGPMGAALGASIGYGVTMEMPTGEGPRLDQLRVQKSSYGDPLKLVYGNSRLSGSVIWMSEVTESKKTEGGKGGGGGGTTTYSYTASVAIAICEGELLGINKIWADTNLIYDPSAGVNEGYIVKSQNVPSNSNDTIIRLFLGEEDQPACSFIRAVEPDAPAYRGVAYLVFEDLDLSPFGNRVPNFSVLAVGAGNIPETTDTVSYRYAFRNSWNWPPRDTHSTLEFTGADGNTIYSEVEQAQQTYADLPLNNSGHRYIEEYDVTLGYASPYSPYPYWRYPDPAYDHTPYHDHSTPYQQNSRIYFLYNYFTPAEYQTGPFPPDGSIGNFCELVDPPNYGYIYWLAPDDTTGNSNARTGFALPSWTGYPNEPWVDLWNNCAIRDEDGNIIRFDVVVGNYQNRIVAWVGYSPPITGDDGEWVDPCRFVSSGAGKTSGVFRAIRFPSRDANYARDGLGLVIKDDDPLYSSQEFWESEYERLSLLQPNELPDNWDDLYYTSGSSNGYDQYPHRRIVTGTEAAYQAVYALTSTTINYCAGGTESSTIAVSTLISELMVKGGYDELDFDVTGISQTARIAGYVIDRTMTLRKAIEPLLTLFAIQASDNGEKLVFKSLEDGASIVVDENSIGLLNQEEPVQVVSKQDFELPKRLVLGYQNPEVDFQTNTQTAERDVVSSSVDINIEVPIAIADSVAAKRAEILLHSRWAERQAIEFTIVDTNLITVNSGDVIQIGWKGWTYEVRLMTVVYSSPNKLECQGLIQQSIEQEQVASAGVIFSPPTYYTSYAEGVPSTQIPSDVRVYGNTIIFPLDVPNSDVGVTIEDSAGFLIGGRGTGNNSWSVGRVFRTLDAGATWDEVTSVSPAIVTGVTAFVSGNLGLGDPFVLDYTQEINVYLDTDDMELESVTYDQLIAGANVAYVGVNGRWEVLQFLTAVLPDVNSPQSYTLSGLLRGRLGTEWASSLHQASDKFILATQGSFSNYALANSAINQPITLRGVSVGQSVFDAADVNITPTGTRLEAYAPMGIISNRNTSLDIIVTWQRRDRHSAQMLWQAPLSEQSESYSVDIYNGANVVRTIASTTPTITYTEADQITDFGSTQMAVTVKIYQLSAIVGRGYPAEAIV